VRTAPVRREGGQRDFRWHVGGPLIHDRTMDPTDIVTASLEAGNTPDQIARSLIEDHQLAPIPAVKALRAGAKMTTGEAKEVVHRNLPFDQQAGAQKLWDDMMELVEGLDE
jgi:hypothetical protein